MELTDQVRREIGQVSSILSYPSPVFADKDYPVPSTLLSASLAMMSTPTLKRLSETIMLGLSPDITDYCGF